MRVLLTGFEPFGGDAINSSQETARAVDCGEFGEIEVVTYILPVSFNRVKCLVRAGLYVCNRTYFAALHHIASTGRNTKALFVHLPKISDEWPLSKLLKAVKQLILATIS